jgi:SulP family sulfate permease
MLMPRSHFLLRAVLVGCIGGIGVFIAKTGLEVTINDAFSIDAITSKWNLLAVIFLFEVVLRILERITKDDHGKPKYTLLSPIYFCMITPVFYFMLFILRVPVSAAEDAGYFFPSLDSDVSVACQGIDCSTGASPSFWDSVVHDGGMWDMWTIINIPTVSWLAVWDSIPTLLALSIFSLIHVPINIPAFALSTNTEADMNNELIAHGYSNMISGLVGGLQNYMAYTQSALYDKSGGTGKQSGAAVALVTSLLFFIGPTIASFIPRCMAGTLLLHVGLDLFLEGVFDSFSKFDRLEYAGIWLIVAVMTMYGMDAAMIAGGIAAVSTYAVQSIAYLSPIRGSMSAVTLRSSNGNRSLQAEAILDSPAVGRSRILVVQLQGHLFFGTVANFTESMYDILRNKIDVQDKNRTKDILDPGADVNASPIVVILDFSLVLGIDSSAAQAIAKLRRAMQKKYSVELCIFVAGSNEGFPTDFDLTKELSASTAVRAQAKPRAQTDVDPLYSENFDEEASEKTGLLLKTIHGDNGKEMLARYAGSHVCESLDRALIYAENALIAKEDPTLLDSDDNSDKLDVITEEPSTTDFSLSEEREIALRSLSNLCPVSIPAQDLELLFSILSREVYHSGEFIWKQHSASNCAKLLVAGTLTALIENEAGTTETILKGNMIGELGLIQGGTRMSSVQCTSSYVIVYSLSRESFENLALKSPAVARYVDLICIKYLNLRVQHVSNRIFETRCLPI